MDALDFFQTLVYTFLQDGDLMKTGYVVMLQKEGCLIPPIPYLTLIANQLINDAITKDERLDLIHDEIIDGRLHYEIKIGVSVQPSPAAAVERTIAGAENLYPYANNPFSITRAELVKVGFLKEDSSPAGWGTWTTRHMIVKKFVRESWLKLLQNDRLPTLEALRIAAARPGKSEDEIKRLSSLQRQLENPCIRDHLATQLADLILSKTKSSKQAGEEYSIAYALKNEELAVRKQWPSSRDIVDATRPDKIAKRLYQSVLGEAKYCYSDSRQYASIHKRVQREKIEMVRGWVLNPDNLNSFRVGGWVNIRSDNNLNSHHPFKPEEALEVTGVDFETGQLVVCNDATQESEVDVLGVEHIRVDNKHIRVNIKDIQSFKINQQETGGPNDGDFDEIDRLYMDLGGEA